MAAAVVGTGNWKVVTGTPAEVTTWLQSYRVTEISVLSAHVTIPGDMTVLCYVP